MVYRLLLGMKCHFDGCLAAIKIKPSSPWPAPIDLTRACTPTSASGGRFSVHPPLRASLAARARRRWGWCPVQGFIGYGSIDRAREGGRAVRIQQRYAPCRPVSHICDIVFFHAHGRCAFATRRGRNPPRMYLVLVCMKRVKPRPEPNRARTWDFCPAGTPQPALCMCIRDTNP